MTLPYIYLLDTQCSFSIIQRRALLKDIGFTDFELLDMTHPAPHRLARIMSALVNYATFRDRRWEFFEQGMIESVRL